MGALARATSGKRGQALLRELRATLEAMPSRRLISWKLEEDGEVCALGALGRARGLDMSKIDPEDRDEVAAAFGVAMSLAAEIMHQNDECSVGWKGSPEERWREMHRWVCEQIKETP
jgi:hypothetical protein